MLNFKIPQNFTLSPEFYVEPNRTNRNPKTKEVSY